MKALILGLAMLLISGERAYGQQVTQNAETNSPPKFTADFIPDYVVIKIELENPEFWPQLNFEFQLINPNPFARNEYRGGQKIAFFDDSTNSFGYRFDFITNPRPVFSPEKYLGGRVGRQEKKQTVQRPESRVLQTDDNFSFRYIAGVDQISEIPVLINNPKYNNIFLNVKKIREEFIDNGIFNFDSDVGIGKKLRFGLFLAWDQGFKSTNEHINVTYEFYKGGQGQYDEKNADVQIVNHNESSVFTKKVKTAAIDEPYATAFALPFDFLHSYLDVDLNATNNIISFGRYEKKQYEYSQGVKISTTNATKSGGSLNPIWFIAEPHVDPTHILDAPIGFVKNGELVDTEYERTSYPTNQPGTGQGMDAPEETISRGARFADGYYPRVSGGVVATSNLWWMSGRPHATHIPDIIEFGGTYQFLIFDRWQYKFDNPDVSEVKLQMWAYTESGGSVNTAGSSDITVEVNEIDILDKAGDTGKVVWDVKKNIATVKKTITPGSWPFGPGTLPPSATPVLEVTINLDNGDVSVTRL